jgi:GT2 family glycosyltransferase
MLPGEINFGAVAIGRNESDRLKRCLQSLTAALLVAYVDSGSTDGSAQWAKKYGAEVVELDPKLPFTAARARNSGLERLRNIAPDVPYVQFVDGDCELARDWPLAGIAFLQSHPDVAAVVGRRRERFPGRSIYNWLCDVEWNTPIGQAKYCGGDALMRVEALDRVGGFRADLIAGEEPELCVRLRAAGWRIWRIDADMTLHDAAMTHFGEWWTRIVRSGYAFAQGAHLHGESPERHFVWESRRAWLWGLWLPIVCLVCTWSLWPWGLALWLIYPLQIFRQTMRNSGSPRQRATLALFQVLGRFAEVVGEIKFARDRLCGRPTGLIEYK